MQTCRRKFIRKRSECFFFIQRSDKRRKTQNQKDKENGAEKKSTIKNREENRSDTELAFY